MVIFEIDHLKEKKNIKEKGLQDDGVVWQLQSSNEGNTRETLLERKSKKTPKGRKLEKTSFNFS